MTDIWGSGSKMKIDEILVYVTHFRTTNKYIKEICGQHRKIMETEEQVIAIAAARSNSILSKK